MSIGMSYLDFWNGDVCMVRAYRKADELNRRKQNEMMWWQGIYIREALMSTVGNMLAGKNATPIEYPAEPHPITEEQIREKKERERKTMEERIKVDLMAMAERMRKKMPKEAHPDSKGGEINERSND